MPNLLFRLSLLTLLLIFLASCGDELPTPKPHAFPRVDFPVRNFVAFDQDFCAFSFQYPDYARVVQDTAFFEERPAHPCWFDLYIPSFDGRIHFTYYPLNGTPEDWEKHRDDAFEMAGYHNKRANYIDEVRIANPQGVHGMAFDLRGPAASPFQFFLSDSTSHFLRAALYFNTQARPDSLAPITEFVEDDILRVLESFRWE